MVKDILIELNMSDNPADLGLHLVAHRRMMDGKFEIWTGDAGRFRRVSGIDCIAWYRWENEMRIDGYAEDVFEMRKEEWFSEWIENKKLPCCDYCGGERKRALLSIIGAPRLCESCATLSVEERNEVKNSQLEECPDSKYEGSLWEYCEEGFRVSWDGHQWDARCTNPLGFQSIFEDVDPVAMEIEGFWNIIEYGGCISTHEKPKPLKRNPNKAPEIKVPWDPYSV